MDPSDSRTVWEEKPGVPDDDGFLTSRNVLQGVSSGRPLNERIHAEQVAHLYRNSPVGSGVSLVGGALLVFALYPQISLSVLLSWYTGLVVVTFARFALFYLYRRVRPPTTVARRWEWRFLVGTALAGVAWGVSMVFLYPGVDAAYQMFIVLVLAGMSAGAVAIFSARMVAYVAFSAPVVGPAAVQFFADGDPLHTVFGFFTLLFLAGMIMSARNSERAVRAALALRFDNQELMAEIAERQRVQDALRASEERFKDFAEAAADWFWEVDAELKFTHVSERFQEVTGLTRAQALGRNERQVFAKHVENTEQWQAHLGVLETRESFESFELQWTHPDRTNRTFQISGKPIFDEQGQFAGYRGVGRDVTEERRKARLLAHQAQHDALTGLVNRREFTRRLEHAISQSKRDGTPCVLCYLDLDHFKVVNDTVGHVAGDELLKQIAGILLGRIRARDTLSRFGGDEFSLLLENCPVQHGVRIAETLLAALGAFRFRWDERSFQVGASIGLVPVVSGNETPVQLLSQADLACYAAKDLGRQRIHVFQAEDSDLVRRQNDLYRVTELRGALERDEFRLYCQPILALSDKRTSHYELLLRLEHHSGELMSPDSFIPAAERYGIMKDIDRWVIGNALAAVGEAFGDDSNSILFINLSGNSLDDDGLSHYIHGQLEKSGVKAERICFEVTETAAIRHLSRAEQLVRQLKGRGHRFALDDFGSGLSSFTYLKRLPVDFLKIDGSFVRDMVQDAAAKAMITAINQIGHVLGIETVAEGVGDDATLAELRDLGVDYAQGHALGKPVLLETVALQRRAASAHKPRNAS